MLSDKHINATKNLDYTTIVDLLRMVSWSKRQPPNFSGKTGLRDPRLPNNPQKLCKQKDKQILNI